MAQECGADLIAAAHHADDQAETVLMGLVRGSAGLLRGMAEKTCDARGAIVRPMLSIRRDDIERFVREKKDWIMRRRQLLLSRPAPTSPEYSDGQTVYLWGKAYRLRLQAAARGRSASHCKEEIILHVFPQDTPAQRESLLNSFYRQTLAAQIAARLPVWEAKTGLSPSGWQIKNMKTRWGTCNTASRKIWLNLQLAKQPPACLDYVLVHELTHLRYPGHGQPFQAFLTRAMPDWQHLRRLLNENTYL